MAVQIRRQEDVLVASIQASLSDADLLALRDALVEGVSESRARGVIVDMTCLDVVDFFASSTLLGLAQMIRLRGARMLIVGIQPHVAFAMVQLGITLEGAQVALDLQEGLACLGSPSY